MEQRQKPVVSAGFTYSPLEEMLDIPQKNTRLHIGIPKETSFQENRIALTPDAVSILTHNGHNIVVEHGAGDGSHFFDTDYAEAGAEIHYDKASVFKADIILKSAPLNDTEIDLLRPHQIVISPIHLAALQAEQMQRMMDKRITLLSFENLKDDAGTYPIVRAMSEIAGGAVMLLAGQYLSNAHHGKGILLGGVTGIPPTKVVIIGAGIVGEFAARTALALGSSVKVFDNNIYKLKRLQNNIGVRVFTSVVHPKVLAEQLRNADVAVGALSSSNGRTPVVVSETMVSNMKAGAVIVDVSIDRGGCFETSHITSHENPIFKKYDVVHYCVPNIASGFARTASEAISNVLMPLLIEAADDGGFENLVWIKRGVRNGIYLYKGALTNYHLSERFKLKYTDLELLLAVKR
ncbi:alanine dehydrogenase [Chitinophaga costaii]|uniref:alanine dehydrogenase n=1 Tax=Chitinophaga costaii TaxID=1335309 RepID=A0A1C4F3J5_9BACT|nr:alanine dehydrogenase [Chitinophaga costaii]PUZ22099.1 alanine dehydrogenase [Chitinophaga costaii]SCC50396.1 alanine dehydrogenase [Chitinophaga costaii]